MNAVPEPVPARFGVELPAARRFELADISSHGRWLIPRLVRQYPHLTERTALGFLNSILYNSEFYFCYQPHAAGLVQVERVHALANRPIIREKFVWVQDASNEEHLAEAVQFYVEFQVWAKHHGAEIIIVEEASDVPHEMIREMFDGKRIFERSQKFVKLPT